MTDDPDRPTTPDDAAADARVSALLRRVRRPRRKRSLPQRILRGLALVVLVVTVCGVGFGTLLAAGFGSDRIRLEAGRALTQMLGSEIVATIGGTRLTFDRDRFLSLEIADAGLLSGTDGSKFLDAGLIRFGVRLMPLLEGRFQLGSATIADARIQADLLPDRGGPGPLAALRDEHGLIDPDLATPAIFHAIHRVFDLVETNGARRLTLRNVDVAVNSTSGALIHIGKAQIARTADESLEIAGNAVVAGRALSFSGTAARDAGDRYIDGFDLALAFDPVDGDAEKVGIAHRIGGLDVRLSGSQSAEAADSIDFEVVFEDGKVELGKAGTLAASGRASARMTTGTNSIELRDVELVSGDAQWKLAGQVAPEAGAYRFALSSDAISLPVAGRETPLDMAADLSGRFSPDERRLEISRLRATAAGGTIDGDLQVQFASGKSPGLAFNLAVADMPVAEVQAVWPWFTAAKAREWVGKNVEGGEVTAGSLNFATVPGQLGNGVPLSDEIKGQFAIADTSVTVAATLPPLQDAEGVVTFDGERIDVSVATAAAQLESGKWVRGRDAVFGMAIPRDQPLIGQLSVEIEADAAAAVEFARLEPIDAGRFLDIEPEAMTGHVGGAIEATIPLQKDAPREALDWLVKLDFADLAIAEPIQGQRISEAYGTATIRPSHAEIDAQARLNGIPADLALIEPFGGSDIERSRKVELNLDDTARDELLPALSTLLSGSAAVAVDLSDGDRQSVTADLSASILNLPWIGWSKGAGIEATTAFQMERQGGQTFLHGFGIKGETFAVGGTVSLDEAGLTKASFPQVRLNRGDDFAVDIVRRNGGYAVTVDGAALDARSIIRAVRAMTEAGSAAGGDGDGAVPIVLDLDVASVSGFGGETLTDVSVDYRGEGATVENLALSGTTASGQKFELTHGIGQAGRFARGNAGDAGAVLRFFDLYSRMQGGTIALNLRGAEGGALVGQVDARDFELVDEPRLASLVTTPSDPQGRSLNQAVRGNINVSRVQFERAFAVIKKGAGYLSLENGIVRGPEIGSTFQGTLYDEQGNMSMTGTFMPAYGINRLFGEIPLIGQILGNGRDGGLIGITYKLAGDADAPQLQINPLSAIAPGIFRSVFEFQ